VPTTTIPLYYSNRRVAQAFVDPFLLNLPSALRWSLRIPRALRTQYHNRPDLITAALLEDPEFASRCHPYVQFSVGSSPVNLTLARVALRHELIPVLQRHFDNLSTPEETYEDLTQILSTIGRIVYLNLSRTDCRVDNLREIPLFDEGLSQ